MKKTLTTLSIISLLVLSVSLNAQKVNDKSLQSEFILKSEKPNFSITFPAKYKLAETTTEKGLKKELYRAVQGNDVYMIKYTEHKNPAVSANNENYMDASLESFITGINATLIKKETFKYKKNKGTEAFLFLDGKSMNVFYRVLIINKVQYQLIVITKAKEKTSDINDFFGSFVSDVE